MKDNERKAEAENKTAEKQGKKHLDHYGCLSNSFFH